MDQVAGTAVDAEQEGPGAGKGLVAVAPKAFAALLSEWDLTYKSFERLAKTAQRVANGQGLVRPMVARKLGRILEAHGVPAARLAQVFSESGGAGSAAADDADEWALADAADVRPPAWFAETMWASLERVSQPCWVGAAAGTVLYFNPALARLFGVGPAQRSRMMGRASGVGFAATLLLLVPESLRPKYAERQAALYRWITQLGMVRRSAPRLALQEVMPLARAVDVPTTEFNPGDAAPACVVRSATGLHIHCDVGIDGNQSLGHVLTRFSEFPLGTWSGQLRVCPAPRPAWWGAEALEFLALQHGQAPAPEIADPLFRELVNLRDRLLAAVTALP